MRRDEDRATREGDIIRKKLVIIGRLVLEIITFYNLDGQVNGVVSDHKIIQVAIAPCRIAPPQDCPFMHLGIWAST